MNLEEIKRHSKIFTPAILIDGLIKHKNLRFLTKNLLIISIILIFISILLLFHKELFSDQIILYKHEIYGLSMISFAVWSISFCIYSFSNYFRNLDISLSKKERSRKNIKVSFELASIIHQTEGKDPATGFITSDFGKSVFIRCGIPEEKLKTFVLNKEDLKRSFEVNADKDIITVYDYVTSMYENDEYFSDFIFKLGLSKKEFLGAINWFDNIFTKIRKEDRWWSKENISKIQPIASDWAYGIAYELEKFSEPIENLTPVSESLENFHKKDIDSLENVLSRSEEANAILIGEEGSGRMAVVGGLTSRINTEKTNKRLINKKIFVLNTAKLISKNKNKNDFEKQIIKIMNQTEKAGNIIMVIDNLPYFIKSAESFNSNLINLINSYLVAPDIKILALSDKSNFHNILEPSSAIMSKFEKVILEDVKEEILVTVLEKSLMKLEKEYKIIFTFPALLSTINSAKRYFTSGVMPDKAIDLLEELAPFVASKNKKIVEKEDVNDLVKKKTGIPVGSISKKEKDTLSNLEEILHKRIVGQDQAVEIISNALKRARSGISNPNKPLGSFLFLGPTGVGKTETSKALAEIFFESSDNMSRLDMSEYQGPDALNQLLGSFESNKAGKLSSILREKPYSVLLLDEFEKADSDVQNLFLQTLDEGTFSDSSGKMVNARNSIIIATSNAGSDLIWKYKKNNEDLKEKTDDIINTIIERGTFSPELLNRFDGVIVFHPLQFEHLEKIAYLEITKLKKRIKEKGVDINISKEVIDHIIKNDLDPKFGARSLNRAIQEKLEKVIAEKIITKNPKPGSVLDIGIEDIT